MVSYTIYNLNKSRSSCPTVYLFCGACLLGLSSSWLEFRLIMSSPNLRRVPRRVRIRTLVQIFFTTFWLLYDRLDRYHHINPGMWKKRKQKLKGGLFLSAASKSIGKLPQEHMVILLFFLDLSIEGEKVNKKKRCFWLENLWELMKKRFWDACTLKLTGGNFKHTKRKGK